MGIFLDINEDNAESEGWRIDKLRRKYGVPVLNLEDFPSEVCKLCGRKFFSDKDLQDHIFEIHRGDQSRNRSSQDFWERSNIKQINFFDIDHLLFDLQNKINYGQSIDDWNRYKKILYDSSEDTLRKQYCTGILEYISSHYQENREDFNDHHSLSEHFGRAYGYLSPFVSQSKIAKQVCSSISLKMNWFTKLASLSDYSVFFLAYHFFTQDYDSVRRLNIPLVKVRQKQGVIIDDFHQELLEILELYYSDRSKLTEKKIRTLELFSQNTNNPNYVDKLNFFKARMFREWGNSEKAGYNYHKIRNNLTFGKEARLFNV